MARSSKLSLLLLLGAINPFPLIAQQPFMTLADSPAWNVLWCVQGTGSYCESQPFQYVDTLSLCGMTYASIPTGFWNEDTMYVRNEGQRTLFRIGSICTDKEYLMYDFTLSVGDTVFAGLNMSTVTEADTAMFVLASIDTISVQGVERRRFNMLFDHCNDLGGFPLVPMEWIEGIGSTMHPFYPLTCICDFCESGYSLLCSDSSGTAIYRSSPDVVCDGTVVVNETVLPIDRLKVSGTEEHIRLQYPAGFQRGRLLIYDATGRVLFNENTTDRRTTVVLPELSIGTYTALIQSDKQQWAARCVIGR